MNLIPEDKLRTILMANESVFNSQKIRDRHYIKDETQAGPYLRYYILLTDAPGIFVAEGFSAEQIFYSRYYWFCRYSAVSQAIAGKDAGLDQQGFMILERPYPECSPDLSVVESIQAQAKQDAATELNK